MSTMKLQQEQYFKFKTISPGHYRNAVSSRDEEYFKQEYYQVDTKTEPIKKLKAYRNMMITYSEPKDTSNSLK